MLNEYAIKVNFSGLQHIWQKNSFPKYDRRQNESIPIPLIKYSREKQFQLFGRGSER